MLCHKQLCILFPQRCNWKTFFKGWVRPQPPKQTCPLIKSNLSYWVSLESPFSAACTWSVVSWKLSTSNMKPIIQATLFPVENWNTMLPRLKSNPAFSKKKVCLIFSSPRNRNRTEVNHRLLCRIKCVLFLIQAADL